MNKKIVMCIISIISCCWASYVILAKSRRGFCNFVRELCDYSGINVPLVAVCNVPPVAQCNVPPQKWLQ